MFINYFYLNLLQILNYVLPLITLPYLARTLGVDKFGLIQFAQSVIQYFVIITDYGFELYATREIAQNRENVKKISEIVSVIYVIKIALLLLCFLVLIVLVLLVDSFTSYWYLYIVLFGFVIGQVFFPVWLFQGLEEMKFILFTNFLSKFLFTISIFVFIKESSDFINYAYIYSISSLLASFVAVAVFIKRYRLKFVTPSFVMIKKYLKASTHFFLSRISVSIYTNSNTVVLGLAVGNVAAGYYVAAEKLYNAIKYLYSPLNNVLYPYMSNKKDKKFFLNLFCVAMIINLLFCGVLYWLSEPIIYFLYGQNFGESARVFKLLIIATAISVPSMMIGYPFLAALGYDSYANYSVVVASSLHLLLLTILISKLTPNLVAGLVLFTEMMVFAIRILGIIRLKKLVRLDHE